MTPLDKKEILQVVVINSYKLNNCKTTSVRRLDLNKVHISQWVNTFHLFLKE